MATKIQLRHDTSAAWTAANPLLAEGEMGVETDTNRAKLGDGVTLWNDGLPYMADTSFEGNYVAKIGDPTNSVQVIEGTSGIRANGLIEADLGFRSVGPSSQQVVITETGQITVATGQEGNCLSIGSTNSQATAGNKGLSINNGGIERFTISYTGKIEGPDAGSGNVYELRANGDYVGKGRVIAEGAGVFGKNSEDANATVTADHLLGRANAFSANGKITTSDKSSGFTSYISPNVGTIVSQLTGFHCNSRAYLGEDDGGTCLIAKGFEAGNNLAQARENYGFYTNLISVNSDVPNGPQKDETFAFYSQASAPSFHYGDYHWGGSSAKSTFSLWKSTLTESELADFDAGNLTAPANVSTPGDGSFARAWYYDRQDAETQAQLDSGELEYPEQFAAATFVDTFALGDNSNIQFSSNTGQARFGGVTTHGSGIQLNGLSGSITSGIGYSSGALRIKVDNNDYISLNDSGTWQHQVNNAAGGFPVYRFRLNNTTQGLFSAVDTNNDGSANSLSLQMQTDSVNRACLNYAEGGITSAFRANAVVAANNYNFYTASAADNYIQGKLQLGGTPASPNIEIESDGNIKAGTVNVDKTAANCTTGIGVFGADTDRLMLRSGGVSVVGLDKNGTTTLGFDGADANVDPVTIRFKGNGTNNAVQEDDNAFIQFAGRNENDVVVALGRFGPVVTADAGTSTNIRAKFAFNLNSGGGLEEKASIDANGLGEFSGGVSVTGGTNTAVEDGMYLDNNGHLNLAVNGGKVLGTQSTATSASTGLYINPNNAYALDVGQAADNTSNIIGCNDKLRVHAAGATRRIFQSYVSPDAGQALGSLEHYAADGRDYEGTVQKCYAFKANSNSCKATTENYGFFSALTSSIPGGFNFYAAGNAPNFFNGDIRVGASIMLGADDVTDKTKQFTSINSSRFYSNAVESSYNILLTRDHNSAGGANYISFKNSAQNVSIGSIQTDGANLVINGQASDYRIKTNITPTASAVNKVKDINVVDFEYTDRLIGETQTGFIAHELAEICPKAVIGDKDATEAIGTLADYDGTELKTNITEAEAGELTYEEQIEATPYVAAVAATYDEEGNELTSEVPEVEATYTTVTRTRSWTATGTRDVYQGVDQTKLIPLLTKALQEALERIEALENA